MKSLLMMAIKCIAALVVITLMLGGGLFYVSEANQRRAVSEQEWNYKYSDLPDARYFAKVAYLGGGNVLLQLCDISSKEILVERTFLYPEAVRLVWHDDFLLYDSDDGSIFHRGTIQFPPTWIDRLLTYAP